MSRLSRPARNSSTVSVQGRNMRLRDAIGEYAKIAECEDLLSQGQLEL